MLEWLTQCVFALFAVDRKRSYCRNQDDVASLRRLFVFLKVGERNHDVHLAADAAGLRAFQ